jgi:hypothetical protein
MLAQNSYNVVRTYIYCEKTAASNPYWAGKELVFRFLINIWAGAVSVAEPPFNVKLCSRILTIRL